MIGLGVLFYVFVERDKQKAKFEMVKEANRVCSHMKMGEVIVRIAQMQLRLKEMGVLTEKEKVLWEALELRRLKLKDTSTPESLAEDIEEFAAMERYKNFE